MPLKSILLLLLSCLLGACALEPKRAEPPLTRVIVQAAEPSAADKLLAYMTQTRKLDAREFAIEREQIRAAFQTEKSEFNRVKLALLLASTSVSTSAHVSGNFSAGASDDAELIALLEPLVRDVSTPATDSQAAAKKDDSQAGIRAIAALMTGLAQDRKKLRDQSRDAQARLSTLRRDDSKELEARALRARVSELERKLAAIKSIDSSVNRRADTQRIDPQRVVPPQ